MAYDIYGNNLRSGHCEVHPWVHESYPCSACYADNQRQEAEKEQQMQAAQHSLTTIALADCLRSAGEALRDAGYIPIVAQIHNILTQYGFVGVTEKHNEPEQQQYHVKEVNNETKAN